MTLSLHEPAVPSIRQGQHAKKILTLQVRSFGQQLLESVAYLHDLDLIHTDLKPENILLVSLEHSKQMGSRSGIHLSSFIARLNTFGSQNSC